MNRRSDSVMPRGHIHNAVCVYSTSNLCAFGCSIPVLRSTDKGELAKSAFFINLYHMNER